MRAWPLLTALLLTACTPLEQDAPSSAATTSSTSSTSGTAQGTVAAPPKVNAQPVQTLTAVRGTLTAERTVAATVKATRTSDVAARMGGTVQGFDVAKGQRVAAGGVVARLDATDARQAADSARQQLQQAQINLTDAKNRTDENLPNLQAAVTSARSGVASAQANVRAAQTGVASAQAAAESARAGVTAAQATLNTAQQDLASAQTLYGVGAISAQELQGKRDAVTKARSGLEQAQSQLSQAQSQVAQSRSQVEQAQAQVTQAQSQLTQAQTELSSNAGGTASNTDLLEAQVASAREALAQAQEKVSRAQVTAPFAGVVSEHLVQAGEFAGQGTAVFRLVDTESIRATFRLPPADAAALTAGTQLNLGYGGKNYVATVLAGEPLAGDDRLVPLEARVTGGEAIPLGATASVRYRITLAAGSVLIPSRAIQSSGAESVVYLAEGGVARRTPVQVLAESDGQVAVAGVKDGDQLIYPLPSSLQDGSRVEVKPAEGQPAASVASTTSTTTASATSTASATTTASGVTVTP